MSVVTSTVRAKIVQATIPEIYNLSMPVAGTEYSQLLSNATKKILIRSRDKTAQIKFCFVSGDSGTNYITLQGGAVYFEDGLDLSGTTVYLQSNKAGNVAEILEWT